MWHKSSGGIRQLPKRLPFKRNFLLDHENKIGLREPTATAKKQTVRLPEKARPPIARSLSRRKTSSGKRCARRPRSEVDKPKEGKRGKSHCQYPAELPSGVVDVAVGKDDPSQYSADIVRNSKISEKQLCFPVNFADMCPGRARSRVILVDWLIQVQDYLRLEQQTLYLAVQILDRFIKSTKIKRTAFQLVGITSLWIAAKYEERFAPSVKELVRLTDDAYSFDEMICMEQRLLHTLKCELHIPTPMLFFKIGYGLIGRNAAKGDLSMYLLDLALPCAHMVHCMPSVQAAAAIYLAHETLRDESQITGDVCMRSLVYHLNCDEADVKDCVSKLAKLLQQASKENIKAARDKYLLKQDGKGENDFENNTTVQNLANYRRSGPTTLKKSCKT